MRNKFYIPILWEQCNQLKRTKLLIRPAITISKEITQIVSNLIEKVKNHGDDALKNITMQLDKIRIDNFKISNEIISRAKSNLSPQLKNSIKNAYSNINTFHKAQKFPEIDIETQPGVRCQQIIRAISPVGLYVPGGSSTLFSTVLMLAIPTKIAGCKRVILCSPPPISDEVLYTADLCKVKEIFQLGGAQAIAALAFGTKSIPKVNKIFGPGNMYVTEAKKQISQLVPATAIDMPAGPSELMIIADDDANAIFIAADLLSQAEHGIDSQVILLTNSYKIALKVVKEIKQQINKLTRSDFINRSLNNSSIIVTNNLDECIKIANQYSPEHLIIQTKNPRTLLKKIVNAGSIFLGKWSPESVGDYASGTNHVLPTYGYAKTYSTLGVIDFQKRITVQELTPLGLNNLSNTVKTLAAAEDMEAHKQSVVLRVNEIKEIR